MHLQTGVCALSILCLSFSARAQGITGLDAGYKETRAWVDFNGDGFDDFCRVIGGPTDGYKLSCTTSTGPKLTDRYRGATAVSSAIDPGYPQGRAWVDVNGDKRADYCRVVGTQGSVDSRVICTLAAGTPDQPAWGNTVQSQVLDWGYVPDRAWVDVDGDGRSDFCRLVGNTNFQSSYIVCCLAGDSARPFEQEVMSPVLDWGYDGTREWVDIDLDGKIDFCRVVGNTREFISCRLSVQTAFDTEYVDLND